MGGEASRRNGAKGGRPRGAKSARTLNKEEARAYYQQWMTERMDLLTGSQFTTACGVSQFVYRDKAGRYRVIDDPDELRKKVDEGAALEIFTRLPNAQAQTDILNRVMDKPAEQEQKHSHSGTFVMRHELPD